MIDVKALRGARGQYTIVDIRKAPDDRRIPGSVRCDAESLEGATALPFDATAAVVVYCGSGNSCQRVAATLRDRGVNALALEGGYRAWRDAGYETDPIA